MKKESKPLHFLGLTFILFMCIAVNFTGRTISTQFSLPGWLDCFGTFFAAYIGGPTTGAIVGVTTNLALAFWTPSSIAYGVIGAFIGIGVGHLARKKYFDTVFHTMTVAGLMTVGAVVIATVLNFIVNGGSTGNVWSDGVKEMLENNGLNKVVAAFIGGLYLEFPDKFITAMTMFFIVKLVRKIKQRGVKEPEREIKALAAAGLILVSCLSYTPAMKAEAAENTAGSTSFIQTVFNGENGLPCGHANSIAQTSDGILWIGTYAGLYRYNGTEFSYKNDLEDIRNVNCLYVDEEGRLWVGTNDNGIAMIINGDVIAVLNSKDGLSSDSVRSIVRSSTGEYYVGTTDGLVTLELRSGLKKTGEIKDIGNVSRLSADSDGHIAAVTSEGELFIIKENEVLEKLSPEDKGAFSSCGFTEDDRLIAGTQNGIIREYELDGDTPVPVNEIACEGLTKINYSYQYKDGSIWLCADNGIGCIDKEGRFFRQESGDFNYSVENMVSDYQGNLWFASSRLGLLRLSASPVTDIFADCGLEHCVVNATAFFGGNLYIGSDDGLIVVDPAARRVVRSELTSYMSGSRIRCLMTDRYGRLWICSYGKGLVSVNKEGKISNYSDRASDLGTRTRICIELSDGRIAVGTSNGLFFLSGGYVADKITFSGEFGYSQVLCMLEMPDGTLYAGTDGNGIAVIKDGKVEKTLTREDGLTSEVVMKLVMDNEDKSIYIVTSNSICRMADGKISSLKEFPYPNNYDVIIDDDGEMFIPGSAGIYVINKKKLLEGDISELHLLNSDKGLMGALTANAWNARTADNKLYLAADRGVYMIDLDNYMLKQRSFRLAVSEIKVDDKVYTLDRSTELSIGRDTSKIEFVPEIINYTYDDPIVSYYLEGFDTDWINTLQSELINVTYTNLTPGEYCFHLAVRDESGNVLEESSYRFLKEKAIYDNYWFRFYMIGVAALFIGWLTWFITRTQMQRTLQIQQTKLSMALQQLRMGNETILAIAKTVDAKDVRTSLHSQRVSEYSAMIAKEYGFTQEEQDNLKNAALLHDIGKIGIPDSVLNKPSRLTDEEYALMKTHVTRGANILKDFTLIDHASEGARYHHERYDGRGYPDGLKGEEIPLYGRIIAIADAFDAMTANRIYRKRQDFDYVMGELHKGRGTQFDPELLDIFLKLIDDKKIDIDSLYEGAPDENKEGEGQ